MLADAKNFNNVYEWAKNTLWFGRRIARYKTNIISDVNNNTLVNNFTNKNLNNMITEKKDLNKISNNLSD